MPVLVVLWFIYVGYQLYKENKPLSPESKKELEEIIERIESRGNDKKKRGR